MSRETEHSYPPSKAEQEQARRSTCDAPEVQSPVELRPLGIMTGSPSATRKRAPTTRLYGDVTTWRNTP
jgi:hypothetical protein